MKTLWKDTGYALRCLLKRPGFTATVLLTLALGIGANSAIFSIVYSTFLGELPFPDDERLVMLWLESPQANALTGTSYPNFEDTQRQSQTLEALTVFRPTTINLEMDEGVVSLPAAGLLSSVFPTLGVEPALGRGFLESEDLAGSTEVVVLSDTLWQRLFARDPGVLGRKILLTGRPFTVVGVMPPNFDFPQKSQLWVPLEFEKMMNSRRRYIDLYQVGRLKPGVSLEAAQQEMNAIADRIEEEHPFMAGYDLRVETIRDYLVGSSETYLIVLLGAVGLVLLIACSNVASLMLARTAKREHEISIRVALGAGNSQLIRQVLTESTLLALGGGLLGILVAKFSTEIASRWGSGASISLEATHLQPTILVSTLVISLVTGFGIGLVPALAASKANLSGVLSQGDRGGSGGLRALRVRSALVVAQIALAMILLVGAGLLIRSLDRLSQVDPGLTAEGSLVVDLPINREVYPEGSQRAVYLKQVLEDLAGLPGVDRIAATSAVLLEERSLRSLNVTVEGHADPPPELRVNVALDVVTPGLFSTLGMTLLEGRDFSDSDGPMGDIPNATVINETMARRYWGSPSSAVGHRFSYGDEDKHGKWNTVIGVVSDARRTAQEREARPSCYQAHVQIPRAGMTLVVNSSIPVQSQVASIRNAIWKIDPNQQLPAIETLEGVLAERLEPRRLQTLLLTLFAALALFLALVGIYGVISYNVNENRRGIGVRMALGARQVDVLWLVLGRTLSLTVVGLGFGLVASFLLTHCLSSLLFSTSPLNAWVFTGTVSVIVVVALLAGILPAHRATRIQPTEILRHQ